MGHLRLACLATALALGAGLTFYEPVLRRDLGHGDGPVRIAVGALRAPLWSAALAQEAGSFTLENVTLQIGSSVHTMRAVRFVGVTNPRAEIEALFDKASTEPFSQRLARIAAKEIAIPELVSELRYDAFKQRSIYRNLSLSGVESGRIKLATGEGVDVDSTFRMDATGKEGKGTARYGRIVADSTDLATLIRFYAEGWPTPSGDFIPVQGSFSAENITVTDPNGLTVTIARVSGRNFSIRPSQQPAFGWMTSMFEVAAKSDPPQEESRRLLAGALELAGSFKIGATEATGIQFAGTSPEGKAVKARIARISYTGATATTPADARAEGVDVAAEDGTAKIDLLAFTGFDFEPTLRGLAALKDRRLDELDPATIRSLVPTIGTIRYAGLAFDVPNAESKAPTPERVKFELKNLAITADKPLNGVPTNLRLDLQNLTAPMPAASEDESVKTLIGLGYRTVDVSTAFAAAWNEAAREIAISEFSWSGVDMGRFAARAILGGVDRQVFDPDTNLAMVALLGASARSAEVTIENRGLFERYLAAEAKKRGKSADAVRREYAAAAAVAIPAMLGNSEQAKGLAQAVARFIARPARLTITARAKAAAGLGISDVVTVQSPAEVMNLLDVTAVAEERL
jgi:hypothetical protein